MVKLGPILVAWLEEHCCVEVHLLELIALQETHIVQLSIDEWFLREYISSYYIVPLKGQSHSVVYIINKWSKTSNPYLLSGNQYELISNIPFHSDD